MRTNENHYNQCTSHAKKQKEIQENSDSFDKPFTYVFFRRGFIFTV